MDDLAALRLQIEWGADEALLDAPVHRFAAPPTSPSPVPRTPPPHVLAMTPGSPPFLAGPTRAAHVAEAARTLAELHAALDGFDACGLRGTASNTVAPSGNPEAGLVLVAEAPGPDDDRSGHAFSGPAGERFDRVIASAGLSRQSLLIAPMVPWRPPGGRPVNEPELALCLPFLHRLLALTRPRRIVMLGAGPLRALTGDTGGIRRARGRWVATQVPGLGEIPSLAMLSPDLWLSSPGNKQATWGDLLLLKEALATL